ncbi:hypothetical protein Mapa_008001 [Marchantia paleacea]|nr:hypothetical protein Mapa_008001 [Marchantia paleacea]
MLSLSCLSCQYLKTFVEDTASPAARAQGPALWLELLQLVASAKPKHPSTVCTENISLLQFQSLVYPRGLHNPSPLANISLSLSLSLSRALCLLNHLIPDGSLSNLN